MLPASVWSALGPVPVILHKKLRGKKKGKRYFGKYNYFARQIHISLAASPLMQWQTLYHEWMHMVIRDAGIQHLLPDGAEEVFCDTVATARLVELLYRDPTK
jgi:hypothetical protein